MLGGGDAEASSSFEDIGVDFEFPARANYSFCVSAHTLFSNAVSAFHDQSPNIRVKDHQFILPQKHFDS